MSAQPIRWDPWALSEEADRRFRRICGATAAPMLALALLFTLYRLQLPAPTVPPPQEKRYVELLRPKAAIQPPRTVTPRHESPHSSPRSATQQARPAPAAPDAREQAEHAGLLQLRQQLAGLSNRQLSAVDGVIVPCVQNRATASPMSCLTANE